MTQDNRESWLNAVAAGMAPLFEALDAPLPAHIRVAIGFTSAGRKGKAIGECWDNRLSADGHFEIFIRPDLAHAADAMPAQIAAILWGQQRIEALPGSEGVDWRASADNLKTLADFRDRVRDAPGTSAAMKQWIDTTVEGISAAHERGEPLWRFAEEDAAATPGEPPAPPAGPVYFVTDGGCASACLDAADLWQALGAIHVGHETSADSLYMDIRQRILPSGLSRIAVPMKVYRGRERGSNEPLRPVHVYPGDLRDTGALAKWIAALTE